MSFFKDLEDNEEFPEIGQDNEEAAVNQPVDDFFDIVEPELPAEPDSIEAEEPAEEVDISGLFDVSDAADASDEAFDEEYNDALEYDNDRDDQFTIITKGTIINGGLISDCSLNVMGTVNGDIECMGKLTITGNVSGNSTASDVFVNAKRLDGNIDSEGSVKIGLDSVVVGNIKATSAVIAGAVKGNLDVNGPVILDSTAIIKGDIRAKSVQMNNGAVLDGHCSLEYSEVDLETIFE